MRVDELIDRLHDLTADEIRHVAAAIRASTDTADGEIAWWRATVTVTDALRRQRRSREAGAMAHAASSAVLAAADRAGVRDSEHAVVTMAARAAAEFARALTAGVDTERDVAALVSVWQPVPTAA
jgi:hypothetical protein